MKRLLAAVGAFMCALAPVAFAQNFTLSGHKLINSSGNTVPNATTGFTTSNSTAGVLGASISPSGSATNVYISNTGCPQGADLNTGFLYGTTTPAPDAGPCITKYLKTHMLPGKMLLLHQDGSSVSSGISGPTGGWGIVSDVPSGISMVTITGCAISNNTLGCTTLPNNLIAGQGIVLNGFATSTYLNLVPAVVSAANLTSTSFQVPFSHADATVENGAAQVLYGSGFFQKAGSNTDVINNGATNPPCPGGYSDPGWATPGPAPARGSGIIFQNLMINGNRVHNSTTGSLTGRGGFTATYGAAYCSFIGMNIYDVNNVDIEGNYFFQTSAYNLRLMNDGFVTVNHNRFDEFGPGAGVYESNSDGLHISGPANNITADGNYFKTGDDAWALNAPEGWVGPITYINITNSQYEQALSGGRMYTYSTAPPSGDAMPTISHITVSGATGTVQVVPFIIGNEGKHSMPIRLTMSDIKFSNIAIQMQPGAYSGNLNLGNGIVIADNIADLSFNDVQIDDIASTSSAPGFINFTDGANVVSLNLTNVTANRNSGGSSVAGIVDLAAGYYSPAGTGLINRLTINGARIVDSDGGSRSAVANAINMGTYSITTLSVSGLDYTNITNLVSNASKVANYGIPGAPALGGRLSTSNVVLASGAGLGTVNTVTGRDGTHDISITTGGSPEAGQALFTTTFTISRGHTSYCIQTPTSNTASALYGAQQVLTVPSGETGYTVYSGSRPLSPRTQYSWSFTCP